MSVAGRRIVVTRSSDQASELIELLEAAGATPLPVPTLAFEPRDSEQVRRVIGQINRYHWVVFTSANAATIFWDLVERHQPGALLKSTARICAVGPATTRALRQLGLGVDLVPDVYRAEGVVESLLAEMDQKAGTQRVLFPAASGARRLIADALSEQGVQVDFVAIYDTVVDRSGEASLAAAWRQGAADLIILTSPSTAENFALMAANLGVPMPLKCASIGPITSAAARKLGYHVVVEAKESTVPALAEAVIAFFNQPD